MARSGNFSGLSGIGGLTLDPFGSGRGGLGRYDVGDTAASLEAIERYAVAVAWQNGTASDEDYLDSLRRWVDMTVEGTRDHISAVNSYEDAVYTIGRNKIVRRVNEAATDSARISAMNDLIAYDQQKRASMVEDNEQRRELDSRISGTKADIRSVKWAGKVRSYNENKLSNAEMRDFARTMLGQAQGAPDMQTWQERVTEFSQRVDDDKLQQLQQDYQYDRVGGQAVLDFVDGRLSGMDRDSPRFADLTRWREDFAKSWRADQQAAEYEEMRQQYQEGRIGDDRWLRFLSQRVEQAPAGSDEKKAAKHELQMETFRVAEDRMSYRYYKGEVSTEKFIKFYQTALRTMNLDSSTARTYQQRIDSLRDGTLTPTNLYGDTPPDAPASPGGGSWQNNIPTGTRSAASNQSGAEAVISAARNYLGTPYRLGAESSSAIDCSGLVWRAFKDAGLADMLGGARRRGRAYIRRLSENGQYTTDKSEAKRGDLVVYGDASGITHMGIYLGDGKVMSALTTNGVTIHRLNGISTQVLGFVMVDYSGADPRTPARRPRNPSMPPDAGDADTPQNAVGDLPEQRDPAQTRVTRQNTTSQVPAAPAVEPTPPSDPYGPTTYGSGRPAVAPAPAAEPGENLPPAMRTIAKDILRGLDAPVTDTNLRAMVAWLNAENPDGNVYNSNFLNVRNGGRRIDQNGEAVFDTYDQGIAATVAALKAGLPEVVGDLRAGNQPRRVITGIEAAGDYNGAIAPLYNSTGPAQPVVTTTPLFDSPPSMTNLARSVPGVADLFNVDPDDPAMREWFQLNLDNMKKAANLSQPGQTQPTWEFVSWANFARGNTSGAWVTYTPGMYSDLLNAQTQYTAHSNTPTDWHPGGFGGAQDEEADYSRDISIDDLEARIRNAEIEGSRLIAHGRNQDAAALAASALVFLTRFLDLPPLGPTDIPDPRSSPFYSQFTPAQWTDVMSVWDSLMPQTTDPQNGQVTGRNVLLGAYIDGDIGPDGSLNPDRYYTAQDPTTGLLGWVSYKTNPEAFAPDTAVGEDGTTSTAPAYTQTMKAIDVGFGVPVWFAPTTDDASVATLEAGNYRATDATAAAPAPAGSQDLFGRPAGSQDYFGRPAGGSAATSAASFTPSTLSAVDFQLLWRGASPAISKVTFIGADGKQYTAWSIGGFEEGGQVLISDTDETPTLVVTPGGLTWKDGQLWNPATNKAYDERADGSIADYVHWYGTDKRDNAGLDVGAKGRRYVLRGYTTAAPLQGWLSDRENFTFTDSRAWNKATTSFKTAAGRAAVATASPYAAQTLRGQEGGLLEIGNRQATETRADAAIAAYVHPDHRTDSVATGNFNAQVLAAQASLTVRITSGVAAAVRHAAAAAAYVAPVTQLVRPAAPTPRGQEGGLLAGAAPTPAPATYTPPVAPTTRTTTYTPPVSDDNRGTVKKSITPKPTPVPTASTTPMSGVSNRPRVTHEYD